MTCAFVAGGLGGCDETEHLLPMGGRKGVGMREGNGDKGGVGDSIEPHIQNLASKG